MCKVEVVSVYWQLLKVISLLVVCGMMVGLYGSLLEDSVNTSLLNKLAYSAWPGRFYAKTSCLFCVLGGEDKYIH